MDFSELLGDVPKEKFRVTANKLLNECFLLKCCDDTKKYYYYRGLSEWDNEPGWLMDTCLDGQDAVIRLLDALGIPH